MYLSEIIVESSKQALLSQSSDGSFPAGFNGPYHDPETPVRNTAHWIITMLKAFEISEEKSFRDSAFKAIKYLLSSDVRPMGATFYCRKNPEKDFCNGLIGQAWAIEALGKAAAFFEESKVLETAKFVFGLHPFDDEKLLWRKVNVDGSFGSIDLTLNHQLWFAAAASTIDIEYDRWIRKRIDIFLKGVLEFYMQTDSAGRISHGIQLNRKNNLENQKILRLKKIIKLRRIKKEDHEMVLKENGYHAFNMYAFSILKKYIPEHKIWKSNIFNRTLEYLDSNFYINGLKNNIFGYPYNPPGFEVALTIQEFSHIRNFTKTAKWWLDQQIENTYDKGIKMLCRSAEDKETLSARLYEATRLNDIKLEFV
jgi:hypothetical protein